MSDSNLKKARLHAARVVMCGLAAQQAREQDGDVVAALKDMESEARATAKFAVRAQRDEN